MAKFQPGQSGNPSGRPPGVKSVVRLRKEMITEEDLQEVVDVVIEAAKGGDLTACGMILDRRIPKLRVNATLDVDNFNLADELRERRERAANRMDVAQEGLSTLGIGNFPNGENAA